MNGGSPRQPPNGVVAIAGTGSLERDLRMRAAEFAEVSTVYADDETVVPDEVVAEHKRFLAGHVALDGFVAKQLLELLTAEQDLIVDRLHRQIIAGRVDEARRGRKRVRPEGCDRFRRKGALHQGSGGPAEDVTG